MLYQGNFLDLMREVLIIPSHQERERGKEGTFHFFFYRLYVDLLLIDLMIFPMIWYMYLQMFFLCYLGSLLLQQNGE